MGDAHPRHGLHVLALPPPWLGWAVVCPAPSLTILGKQSAALTPPRLCSLPWPFLSLSRLQSTAAGAMAACRVPWLLAQHCHALLLFPLSPAGRTTASSSVSLCPSSTLVAVYRHCRICRHCRLDAGACGLGTLLYSYPQLHPVSIIRSFYLMLSNA
jgi:hypothetical protein